MSTGIFLAAGELQFDEAVIKLMREKVVDLFDTLPCVTVSQRPKVSVINY